MTPSLCISTAEFTRPANAFAYAVGDAVANSTSAPVALEFDLPVRNGVVYSATLFKSSNVGTNAIFRLHLYSVAPTPTNDNAALSVPYSDRAKYIGSLVFTCTAAGSGAAFAQGIVQDVESGSTVPALLFADNGDNKIYGLLEARGAYTPGNAETFSIRLNIQEAE